jgi:hypothetical protein
MLNDKCLMISIPLKFYETYKDDFWSDFIPIYINDIVINGHRAVDRQSLNPIIQYTKQILFLARH